MITYENYLASWEPDWPEMAPLSREEWQQARQREDDRRLDRRDLATKASLTWLAKYGAPARATETLSSEAAVSTPALEAIEAGDDLIVLSGLRGSGKTVAAVEWLRQQLERDAHARIDGKDYPGQAFEAGWSAPEDGQPSYLVAPPVFLTATALARWSHYNEDEVRRLLQAPYVVIDDLGFEYLDKNGFYLSLLDEVVDTRYAQRLKTVMTTNLTAADFKARYGERIADRIREAGRFINVSIPSMRKKEVA